MTHFFPQLLMRLPHTQCILITALRLRRVKSICRFDKLYFRSPSRGARRPLKLPARCVLVVAVADPLAFLAISVVSAGALSAAVRTTGASVPPGDRHQRRLLATAATIFVEPLIHFPPQGPDRERVCLIRSCVRTSVTAMAGRANATRWDADQKCDGLD